MKELCIWKFIECVDTDKKGKANKWQLKTDCGREIIMTKTNSFGRLFKLATQPNAKEICLFCKKEVDFFNPSED